MPNDPMTDELRAVATELLRLYDRGPVGIHLARNAAFERLRALLARPVDEHDCGKQPGECESTCVPSAETPTTPDVLRCSGCEKPYSEFALDVHLPDDQWLRINGREGGVLCANCIARGLYEAGATVMDARGDLPASAPTNERVERCEAPAGKCLAIINEATERVERLEGLLRTAQTAFHMRRDMCFAGERDKEGYPLATQFGHAPTCIAITEELSHSTHKEKV